MLYYFSLSWMDKSFRSSANLTSLQNCFKGTVKHLFIFKTYVSFQGFQLIKELPTKYVERHLTHSVNILH
jgi:hypothetical protein